MRSHFFTSSLSLHIAAGSLRSYVSHVIDEAVVRVKDRLQGEANYAIKMHGRIKSCTPGRHILENYTGNTRVFGVEVVYFLRKYTVYFPCNSRVPAEITRITREIATPQWRNDEKSRIIAKFLIHNYPT